MENIVEKISQEIQNNPELNEDINDIGLPKSSLHSFVKEFLSKNKVRGDKNIIPMLDKISRYYVTFISKVGAQICEDCQKKTLNLEHIFEALKRLNFHKHIELLANDSKNQEGNEEDEEGKEKLFENKNLKQLINKKKKRNVRKKKYYENEDEKNQMIQEENELFEKARLEMLAQESKLSEQGPENQEEENNHIEHEEKEDLKEEGNQKNEDGNVKDNMFINNKGEDDINFDE